MAVMLTNELTGFPSNTATHSVIAVLLVRRTYTYLRTLLTLLTLFDNLFDAVLAHDANLAQASGLLINNYLYDESNISSLISTIINDYDNAYISLGNPTTNAKTDVNTFLKNILNIYRDVLIISIVPIVSLASTQP